MTKDFLVSGVFRGYKARNELTEIQYLQIETNEKGTHTNQSQANESMMLKFFICMNSLDEQSARK